MGRRKRFWFLSIAVGALLCAAVPYVHHRAEAQPPIAPVSVESAGLPKRASLVDGSGLSVLGPDKAQEFRCLALNVYWEARSESLPGKLAVAAVTLNRVADPEFPKTICGVVHQGKERGRHQCQFSWVCDGKGDQPKDQAAWGEAQTAAYTALAARRPDPTGGALYYHAVYVRPSWAKTLEPVGTIGRHVYYRERTNA